MKKNRHLVSVKLAFYVDHSHRQTVPADEFYHLELVRLLLFSHRFQGTYVLLAGRAQNRTRFARAGEVNFYFNLFFQLPDVFTQLPIGGNFLLHFVYTSAS